MFDCFKKQKVIVSEPVMPKPEDLDSPYRSIALVVGHNSKASGADNYLGESEYSYYDRITKKLVKRLDMINPKNKYVIIHRPAVRSYKRQVRAVEKQCIKHGIKEAYLFHFNDAESKTANGLEFLHTSLLSVAQKLMAANIAKSLAEASGSKLRGDMGLRLIRAGHNGYGMLNTLETNFIDTILLEPCFAKDKSAGYFFFETENRFVDVLARGILSV